MIAQFGKASGCVGPVDFRPLHGKVHVHLTIYPLMTLFFLAFFYTATITNPDEVVTS